MSQTCFCLDGSVALMWWIITLSVKLVCKWSFLFVLRNIEVAQTALLLMAIWGWCCRWVRIHRFPCPMILSSKHNMFTAWNENDFDPARIPLWNSSAGNSVLDFVKALPLTADRRTSRKDENSQCSNSVSSLEQPIRAGCMAKCLDSYTCGNENENTWIQRSRGVAQGNRGFLSVEMKNQLLLVGKNLEVFL